MTSDNDRWYWWFLGALILVGIGFGALAVLGDGLTATGEEDTGLVNGLSWLAWILSWLGAIVSIGLGVVRLVGHRREASA